MSRAALQHVRRRERAALFALLVGLSGACDADPRFDSGCPSGTAGCPCLPEGGCEGGEGECLEDICVRAPIEEPIPPQDHGPTAGGAGGSSAEDTSAHDTATPD